MQRIKQEEEARQTRLQEAKNAANDEYLVQSKALNDLIDALSAEQTKLANSGSDTTAPVGSEAASIAGHWNPSKTFVGDCAWRISPNPYTDQVCKTKQEELNKNVNRLKIARQQAEAELIAKQQAKQTAEAAAKDISASSDSQTSIEGMLQDLDAQTPKQDTSGDIKDIKDRYIEL